MSSQPENSQPIDSKPVGCPSIVNSTHNEAYWRAHEAVFKQTLHGLSLKDCVFYHRIYLDALKGNRIRVNIAERDRFTDLWTTVKAIHREAALQGKYLSWHDFINALRNDWYDKDVCAIRKALVFELYEEKYNESNSHPDVVLGSDGNPILAGIPDLLTISEEKWVNFSRTMAETLIDLGHNEFREVFFSVIPLNATGVPYDLAWGRNMWVVLRKLDDVLKTRGVYLTKQQFIDNIRKSPCDVIRVDLVKLVEKL